MTAPISILLALLLGLSACSSNPKVVRHESVTTECRSLAVNTAPPATLLLLGDIMLQGEAAKKAQDQGTLYPFALVSKPFALYDRRFANLEVSITARKSRWVKKKYTFRATPAQAMSLLSLKLDVVSLANNHMLDFGPRGLTDTMTWLTKHTIAFTGAGANSKAARRGVTLDLKGTKAIFLAYNERPPKSFFATKRRPGTARLYEPQIIHDIKRLKKKDNLVFVSLHWGTEHTDIPRPYQVKRAHRLIRAGADAIIGHHPHRPQSLEMYRGKPVIYSLGNFISGFANPLYRDNIAVVLHYKKTTLKKMEVLFLHGQMASRGYRPSIITDPAQVRANFEHLKKISRSFRLKAVLSGSKMIITP